MGNLVEESFAGSCRRVRLRLPHLPGTRQVAPALAFGEEGLLVDATLPPDTRLTGDPVWTSLSGWTILKKAARRVLYHPAGEDPASLEVACHFAERLQASVTVLGIAPAPESGGGPPGWFAAIAKGIGAAQRPVARALRRSHRADGGRAGPSRSTKW